MFKIQWTTEDILALFIVHFCSHFVLYSVDIVVRYGGVSRPFHIDVMNYRYMLSLVRVNKGSGTHSPIVDYLQFNDMWMVSV